MTRRPHKSISRTLPVLFAFVLAARGANGQDPGVTSFENISVGTVERADVSRLVDAGVVNLGDASGMVVTVGGELRGRAERNGSIGVIFLPEMPFFNAAFRNRKILLSVADAEVAVAAGDSSYFLSKPKRLEAGFTQYHLYLFNSTGATASVNVYVHAVKN
jgi:hypothetical protein